MIVQGIPTVSRAVINEEVNDKGEKNFYLLGTYVRMIFDRMECNIDNKIEYNCKTLHLATILLIYVY